MHPTPLTLSVCERDVAVRWVETDALTLEHIGAMRMSLCADELARADAFRFERDRNTFVAAHALARAMLSAATPRPLQSWTFAFGPFKKPEPVMAAGEPALRLSISHTRGLAMVAMSSGRALGVDVEWTGRPAPFEVAKSVFHPSERAVLEAAPEPDRARIFYTLWTVKESYIKADGRGMHIPLTTFAVSLDPLRPLHGLAENDLATYEIQSWSVSKTHMAALSTEGPPASVSRHAVQPAELAGICSAAAQG